MTLLEHILEYNEEFVANKAYEAYSTSKTPSKKRYYSLVWIHACKIYQLKHSVSIMGI